STRLGRLSRLPLPWSAGEVISSRITLEPCLGTAGCVVETLGGRAANEWRLAFRSAGMEAGRAEAASRHARKGSSRRTRPLGSASRGACGADRSEQWTVAELCARYPSRRKNFVSCPAYRASDPSGMVPPLQAEPRA